MDVALLRALNGLRAPWLDRIATPLSAWGYYLPPLVFLVVLLVGRRRVAAAVRDGFVAWALASLVSEDLVKGLVARPRPTAVHGLRESLHVLGRIPPPTSLSFPSGTAAACFAGATWMGLAWGWRRGAIAGLVALLVSLVRVYAGVHYPSDVLGGAVIGIAVALGVQRFARWIETPSV